MQVMCQMCFNRHKYVKTAPKKYLEQFLNSNNNIFHMSVEAHLTHNLHDLNQQINQMNSSLAFYGNCRNSTAAEYCLSSFIQVNLRVKPHWMYRLLMLI